MLQKRRRSERKHNAVQCAVSQVEAALMFALAPATLPQHWRARQPDSRRLGAWQYRSFFSSRRHGGKRSLTTRSTGRRCRSIASPDAFSAAPVNSGVRPHKAMQFTLALCRRCGRSSHRCPSFVHRLAGLRTSMNLSAVARPARFSLAPCASCAPDRRLTREVSSESRLLARFFHTSAGHCRRAPLLRFGCSVIVWASWCTRAA